MVENIIKYILRLWARGAGKYVAYDHRGAACDLRPGRDRRRARHAAHRARSRVFNNDWLYYSVLCYVISYHTILYYSARALARLLHAVRAITPPSPFALFKAASLQVDKTDLAELSVKSNRLSEQSQAVVAYLVLDQGQLY